MLKEKDGVIARAIDELDRISQDAMIREAYDKREMEIMSYNTNMGMARDEGHAEGHEAGRLEEKIEMAKEMLADGMSLEVVSKYTKFPIELIETLTSGIQDA